ncbi:segregation/condensation protein A [Pelagibius litoralis]|uniref:Segregation and condensation protein A n=1 Tax=Pelagibius litoralis TaxID=374515 RepID=A0A967C213_9PROT|nr:ScpA family protein [Pelagibius litoralis]NIA67538.1 segregation/condensation protein A [Pelagibius litoralis]
MSDVIPFEEGVEGARSVTRDRLLLDLDGYAGPIDILLELARAQKVDLTQIRILDLAEQYLEFVREARALRLELAADYLVMAAWLAYLKSRLLLPETGGDEEPSGAEMAAALKFQMQRLQAMRDAGEKLRALPQLDHDIFRRGTPERLRTKTTTQYEATLFDLLKAYGHNKTRATVTNLEIRATELYSVDDAMSRLSTLFGTTIPGWRSLSSFLPPDLHGDPLLGRSALAATFAASLELCKTGKLRIRQDGTFGPIYLRNAAEEQQEHS